MADDVIIEAGKSIESEGRVVNGFGLRKKIGGGEQRRLMEVWMAYKASLHAETSTQPSTLNELPTSIVLKIDKMTLEFTQQLRSLVIGIYDLAKQDIAEQLNKAIDEQASQAKVMQQALDDADAVIGEITEQNETLLERVEQMSVELAQARELAQVRAVETAQEKERSMQYALKAKEDSERAQAELGAMAERIQVLLEQNQQEQSQSQLYKAKCQELDAERKMQEKQTQYFLNEIDELKKLNTQLHEAQLNQASIVAEAQNEAKLYKQFYEQEQINAAQLQQRCDALQLEIKQIMATEKK